MGVIAVKSQLVTCQCLKKHVLGGFGHDFLYLMAIHWHNTISNDCIMSSMVLSQEYLSPFLYVEKTNIALNFDHCQDSKIEDDFLFKPYYLIAV